MATALASNRQALQLWAREWTFSTFLGRPESEQSTYSQNLLLASGSKQKQSIEKNICFPETRLEKPCFRACVSDESAKITAEFIEDSPDLLEVPDEIMLYPDPTEKDGFGLGLNDEADALPARSVAWVMGQEVLVPAESRSWAPKSGLANREDTFDSGFYVLSEKDERDVLNICELISAFAGRPMSEGQDEWDWLLMDFRRRFVFMQPVCKSATLEVLRKPAPRASLGRDSSYGSLACDKSSQYALWSQWGASLGADFFKEDGSALSLPSSMPPSFLSDLGLVDNAVDGRKFDHVDFKVDMKEFYKAVGQSLTTKSTMRVSHSGSTSAESPGGLSTPASSSCLSRAPTGPSTEGRSEVSPFKGDCSLASAEQAPAASAHIEKQRLAEPVCSLLPVDSCCGHQVEDVPDISTKSQASFARGPMQVEPRSDSLFDCGCFGGLRKKLPGAARSTGATAPPPRLVVKGHRVASASDMPVGATPTGGSYDAGANVSDGTEIVFARLEDMSQQGRRVHLAQSDDVSQLGRRVHRPLIASC